MKKPKLFFGITEDMNDIKCCKSIGMKPCKFVYKTLDGIPFRCTIQYSYKGFTYYVLEENQCYSGFMVTLMRLPQLSYFELLETALTSRSFDERAGAIGIILKDYSTEFEKYLLNIKNTDLSVLKDKKSIKKLVKLINEFIIPHTSYVDKLENIVSLCEFLQENI